jgi:hypothetical protein
MINTTQRQKEHVKIVARLSKLRKEYFMANMTFIALLATCIESTFEEKSISEVGYY